MEHLCLGENAAQGIGLVREEGLSPGAIGNIDEDERAGRLFALLARK
jgi:hypothetical protein